MYNKFIEPYRAKIDKAFAELEGGADFAQVMLKYTENEYVAGSDSYGGCETFRTKGQLISTKHSSSKGDWSSTVKEIYSLLKPGEYSDVFTDTDGSLHIIFLWKRERSRGSKVNACPNARVSFLRQFRSSICLFDLYSSFVLLPLQRLTIVRAITLNPLLRRKKFRFFQMVLRK